MIKYITTTKTHMVRLRLKDDCSTKWTYFTITVDYDQLTLLSQLRCQINSRPEI